MAHHQVRINRAQIEDVFLFRHATKDFDTNKKVSRSDFDTILEAGRLSPSSFGFEPWQFLVLDNPEKREELRTVTWGAQKQLPHASHFVIILARKGRSLRPRASYIQELMRNIHKLPAETIKIRTNFFERFQKTDFLLNSDADRFSWAKRQTYIPLANMMTAAALLGIDSCPIEGFEEAAVNRFLKKQCGIDTTEFGVSVMVAFGYRREMPRTKVRRPLSEVVTYIS